MEIEGLHPLHLINKGLGSLQDLSFCLPKVLVFSQVFRVNSHLDDFSICLELFKDVEVDLSSVVNILKVLVLQLLFPLTQ
jgi:hypothetical protein